MGLARVWVRPDRFEQSRQGAWQQYVVGVDMCDEGSTTGSNQSPGKRMAGKMEPARCRSATVTLRALESKCPDDIPGPRCGNPGVRDPEKNGYVHVHAGIHGSGPSDGIGLDPSLHDWRNPVAEITIKRLR